jgi:hypothetical protein
MITLPGLALGFAIGVLALGICFLISIVNSDSNRN